ncbi:hypothetical protein MGYG_01112 [Nannizzia gypsea CBS 118893]|uniref:LPXTG-motif cell wall anchor domain-containing protein n=1 Tax=Arthroderma gypseum (strain ATCC MYA-4604 / CBS 118893) TaxID=535722 RepID=E5QYV2_ARTGP|nr:hypothetical protein MGYG_01112 [Nannizzia gypsea CBS 118893]EFQ98075.1 hypothetical protein MGYG_01112 [Nannizzia gypsea CBS 118893]
MLLEKTSSTSITTLVTPTKSARDKGWLRNRRQTDPLIREPVQLPQPRPNRHSIDAANANANAGRHSNQQSSSSPLSSESFSNPALASFSPRKTNIHTPSRPSSHQYPYQYQLHHSNSNSNNSSTINSPTPSHHPHQLFYTPTPLRQGDQDQYLQTPSRLAEEPPPPSSSPNIRHITTSFINTNTSLTSPVSPDSNNNSFSHSHSHSFHFTPAKDSKSPHYKRAPASRSSLGIETASGPPPALSTQQRSVAQDKQPWQLVSTADPPLTRRPTSDSTSASASASLDSDPKSNYSSAGTSTCLDLLPRKEESNTNNSINSSNNFSTNNNSFSNGNTNTNTNKNNNTKTNTNNKINTTMSTGRDRSLRASVSMEESTDRDRDAHFGGTSRDSPRGSKVEDLFLNIAQSSSRLSTDSKARRRSKFSLSSRAKTTEDTPSPDRGHYSSFSQDASPRGNYELPTSRVPASAHPLDEAGRSRFFSGSGSGSTIGRTRPARLNHEMSPEPPQRYMADRRDSVPDFVHKKPYKSSLASSRKSRAMTSYDAATDRNIGTDTTTKSKNDGTESTMSTTAPSTVWDELDDLKSRIRKLELTGKLPCFVRCSHVLIGRGATPNGHDDGNNDPAFTVSQVHPLLHTALAKAKPVLNNEVYQALESTATDAINLSTALASSMPHTSSMSVVTSASTPDRVLRRKADSVCRGLTELCLALSEDKLRPATTSRSRPVSRDATTVKIFSAGDGEPGASYRRSISHEPEEFNFSRLQSSLNRDSHSRRTSTLNLSPSMTTLKASPSQEVPDQSTTHLTTPSQSRVNRRSSLLRSRRQEQEEYDTKLQPTTNGSLRPVTRSMTVTDSMHMGRDRFHRSSRECTPEYANLQQENSPSNQHTRTPAFRATTTTTTSATPSHSGIPLRRSFLSTSNNVITGPSVSIQPGSRRYGSGQPTIRAVIDDYSGPRTSLGGGGGGVEDDSPQQRSAGRTIPQFSRRPRTNSLGTGRAPPITLSTRRTFEGTPGR